MMEKKMEMMQEMMNGIMAQQKMMGQKNIHFFLVS